MAIPFVLTKLLARTGLARWVPAARRLTDGDPAALRYYSDKVLAAPVEELLDPATFPAAAGPDVLDLNLSAPPAEATRAVADRGGNPPAGGLPALRRAVAATYRRRDGRTVDPATEVLITHGATGAWADALDAFVNPGSRVVLFDPSSPLFGLGAKSRRARVRWVPTWAEDGRARFDPDVLLKALRGATLLALADPMTPHGGTLADEDLERIAWATSRRDVLIYLDESFGRFRYDGRAGSLATLPGADRRTLSAGSVTQGHGLPGTRVGWLAGPRHLVRACTLTASLSAPWVPAACQGLALRAVEADDDLFGPVLEEFRDRRRYVHDQLKAMGFDVGRPGGGYYFWLPVAPFGLDGRAFAERLLREQKVLVGPGTAFGHSGAEFVRLSFAAEEGRLREGLRRLATFVAGLRGEPEAKPVAPPQEGVQVSAADERPPAFSRV